MIPSDPIDRRTFRAQAGEIVRTALLSGRFRPGDKINEAAIARELMISRGPVREAMRHLEQEGLVISIPHRGSFVRELTDREVDELQEVRLALETAAAVRVAQMLTPELKAQFEERLDDLRRAEADRASFAERLAADLALHEAVCVASGNGTLDDVWRTLIGRITVMLLSVGEEDLGHLHDADSHRPLIDAIASGDESLVRETYRQVFDAGKQTVLESVKRRRARSSPEEPPAERRSLGPVQRDGK